MNSTEKMINDKTNALQGQVEVLENQVEVLTQCIIILANNDRRTGNDMAAEKAEQVITLVRRRGGKTPT